MDGEVAFALENWRHRAPSVSGSCHQELDGTAPMGYDSTMTALPVTVVETQAFIAAAKDCLAEEERFDAITLIANNPECGDLIPARSSC